MSSVLFVELMPEVAAKLNLPSLPIPIRRERQAAIFPEGRAADVPAILDEIALFLKEHPQYTEVYRVLVAKLCYLVGIDAATQGYHAQAAHYLGMGLDAAPQSVALRSHYALALHCSGRVADARREYERVIAITDTDQMLPVMWMMLARIYANDHEYQKAYWLLKDVSTLIPDEDGFWDFLSEMEEQSGRRSPSS